MGAKYRAPLIPVTGWHRRNTPGPNTIGVESDLVSEKASMKQATRLSIGAVLAAGLLLAGCGSSSGPRTKPASRPVVTTLAPTTTTTLAPPLPPPPTLAGDCTGGPDTAINPSLTCTKADIPDGP
jgi:hypothetical protein